MYLGWICLFTPNMDTTCGNLGAVILGNPSSFRHQCGRLSLNVTPQRFNLLSSRSLFAPRLLFPRECLPHTVAAKRRTAPWACSLCLDWLSPISLWDRC